MVKLSKFAAPAMAAALALAAAMPAQARDYGPSFEDRAPSSRTMNDFRPHAMPDRHFGHFGIRTQIADLRNDIDRAAAMHRISWREAKSLNHDARRLERLYSRYARGGLNRWELASLHEAIGDLRMSLRFEKRDRGHRRS